MNLLYSAHSDGNWTLRVTNAKALNNGKYIAVAANRCGRTSTKVQIEVQTDKPDKKAVNNVESEDGTPRSVSLTISEEVVEFESKRPRVVNTSHKTKRLSTSDSSFVTKKTI